MKFRIEIDCSNAAFGDGQQDWAQETSKILAQAMLLLDAMDDNAPFYLSDSNGNCVGDMILKVEGEEL